VNLKSMGRIRWCSEIEENGKVRVQNVERIDCRQDVVHVITVCLDETVDGMLDLLDPEERDRAARFVFDRDRRRFIVSHAWTRLALASCLDCAPESLRFYAGPTGKPRLLGTPGDVRFNVSHSGERALVALALGQEVGVDIEQHRPVDVIELANKFFERSEIKSLERLSQTKRVAAFFRCWTRKEAFVKALGNGLAFPLDGFKVSVLDDHSSQLLCACDAAPEALDCWRIIGLRTDPGYSAALAAGRSPWRVVQWRGREM